MKSAFAKGIWRTIAQSRKRFISILAICALGITMVCGLRAACVDLRQTADDFYDAQKLFDIKIQSTLGFSDADVSAIAQVEGASEAEGAWEETTYTTMGEARASVDVKALLYSGMNQPVLLEGALPTQEGEVAVTRQYLHNSGASIGDSVELDPADDEESAVFERVPYTIVGVVLDPAEMTNPTGSIAIRAAASSDYFFFVDPSAVLDDSADTFTALYVQVAGAADDLCYSQAYEQRVSQVVDRIDALREEQEAARTQEIKQEALDTIAEEEARANEELVDAAAQLDEAQDEIDEGWAEIADSRATLKEGESELESGQAELDSQAAELESGQAQLEEGYAQLESGQAQVDAAYEEIAAGEAQLEAGIAQVNEECDKQAASAKAAFDAGQITDEEYEATLVQVEAAREEQLGSLEEQQESLAAQKAELDAKAAELASTKAQLDEKSAQLASGAEQLEQGRATLEASREELEQGRAELSSGEDELARGQAELDANRATYEQERADAEQKIADARAEVEDIEDARWYIQDRSSNTAYSSVSSDAGSIEAIGFVFPVVFIIVAVLIGLTTITRMVEEERGLIGTYKSLGYSNARILSKYFIYALSACVIGGALGLVCGFVAFPFILFNVFSIMYSFDGYRLCFDPLYGFGSFLLFALGIAGAAVLACKSELKQTPAALMRPKAPRSGSRILLERIGPLWRRLSFLNKVSARNLFRYKKRLFMTVLGIMGCMALLVCGFAIRDTVEDISDKQYEEINRYDLLVSVDSSKFDEVAGWVYAEEGISSAQAVSIDNVTLSTQASEESLQLYIIPDDVDISAYVNLRAGEGEPVEVPSGGMLLTRNAAELLEVAAQGTVTMKTSAMDVAEVEVAQVIDGYLGNAAYLRASTYEQLFGQAAKSNAFYVNLSDSVPDNTAFGEELAMHDGIRSVNSTQQMIDEFSQAFQLINTVVAVIIVLAAALAFVVLFTLSTTNISERVRELATIKVLGFRRHEVNHYVNKETLLLTGLGVLLGIPAGYAFSHSLTYVLKMPSIYFAVYINPLSYVYAVALTLFFAVIVALLSNRALAKIDMIEALKSVE